MTIEEQVIQLKRELEELKSLFYKDSYSNLQVFRKKIEFKGDATINGDTTIANLILTALETTGGTAPIADGNHTITIPDGGGSATIATKNGVITSIT